MKTRVFILLALVCALVAGTSSEAKTPKQIYRSSVVNDWTKQESHLGRNLGSPEALQALIERSEAFLEWIDEEGWANQDDVKKAQVALENAKNFLDGEEKESEDEDVDLAGATPLYLKLRQCIRKIALSHPEIKGTPIVFLKQERFVWQMLHEFMSYYYEACGMYGGGIFVLKNPGESFETECLTNKFPKGVFQTPSLSYDGKTVYFAFADFSKVMPEDAPKLNVFDLQKRPYMDDFTTNYMKKEDGKFHIFKLNIADKSFEQLTEGSADDFDPTEAPDGSLIFMSTRRGGFGRCHGHYEPLAVHTLHRLNADKSITCISWHETNEWQPTFLPDGRVLYSRWDYVDRSASRHHGLWTTNPDGTNSAIFFGNYTYRVCACYNSKPIPGSNRVMFIGGAHHLDVGGSILAFDPTKVKYDPETAEDDMSSIEFLTPEVPIPESDPDPQCVPSTYYHSPWPLSEDVWLTAYSHEALGGYLANTTVSGKLGLYYRDRFGNLELLYENLDNDESCMFPMPIAEREKPAIIPSSLPEDQKEATGTFVLANVYESLKPFPEGRKVKELRIVQLLPKYPDYRGHVPPNGHPFASNNRFSLGTVPVEEDGSAYFKAPANVPVYFQALDEEGRAVQSMRSIVYLQPGENRGCVGCHEQALTVQTNENKQSIASLRDPSELKPDPEETRPFSYPRFIQPILDRRCVSCHDGSEGNHAPQLTGEIEGSFTKSYNELRPFVKWYEWGGNSFRQIVTYPGEAGADISPLSSIINDDTHKDIGLTDQEKRDIYLWLDFSIPFYGVYEAGEQAKQKRGERVELPVLQ